MANETEPNHWEQSARSIKAAKIAAYFTRKGITADELRFLDDAGWAAASKLAGIRLPSTKTRAVVIEMLTEN